MFAKGFGQMIQHTKLLSFSSGYGYLATKTKNEMAKPTVRFYPRVQEYGYSTTQTRNQMAKPSIKKYNTEMPD